MANAICERVIGTIRRACLDWLIPLSESLQRMTTASDIERLQFTGDLSKRPRVFQDHEWTLGNMK
jgi:hypothetical protein